MFEFVCVFRGREVPKKRGWQKVERDEGEKEGRRAGFYERIKESVGVCVRRREGEQMEE